MQRPRRLRSDIVSRHPFLELLLHELELEQDRTRQVITLAMPDWVAIAAVTLEGDFVLVRQHRHGIDGTTLEPAGGIVDADEAPETAALRELLEETGYQADSAEPLGWVHPNPALQDNRCHLFLARGVRSVAEPHRSADEDTEAVRLSPADVRAALLDGRITHALGLLALMRALEKLG